MYGEGGREKKAGMGMCWSSGWEVITVCRRDTLIRAGGRYARHAAMLQCRRPCKCDGPIQQNYVVWVGEGRASLRTRKGQAW